MPIKRLLQITRLRIPELNRVINSPCRDRLIRKNRHTVDVLLMSLLIDDETLDQRIEYLEDTIPATSDDMAVFLASKSVYVVGEAGDEVDFFSCVEVPDTDGEIVTCRYQAFVLVEFEASYEVVVADEGTDHVACFDVPEFDVTVLTS